MALPGLFSPPVAVESVDAGQQSTAASSSRMDKAAWRALGGVRPAIAGAGPQPRVVPRRRRSLYIPDSTRIHIKYIQF